MHINIYGNRVKVNAVFDATVVASENETIGSSRDYCLMTTDVLTQDIAEYKLSEIKLHINVDYDALSTVCSGWVYNDISENELLLLKAQLEESAKEWKPGMVEVHMSET